MKSHDNWMLKKSVLDFLSHDLAGMNPPKPCKSPGFPVVQKTGVFPALLLAVLFFFLNAAWSHAAHQSITVAAAADLTFALKEAAAGFEKNTGVKAVLSFGSSGMLSRQIEEGAPFDIFFSADSRYIEGLKKSGRVIADTAGPYARGSIVLAVNESGAKAAALEDLLSPEIRKVAIANPAHAPYGRAAMEALKAKGLWERVKPKLVYGENITQTLNYIQTGDAGAGIIALSIAGVPGISYTRIAPALYSPIEQTLAIVKGTKNEGASREFIKYLKGPEGKAVLEKYGFMVPD